MKYRMQAPNVPTSQFQPRDYVGPALQSFQAGQKMGQQRAMNKAASRYLMSGGADQEAAQTLSQMNPDAYLKATQQIQAQQKASQQAAMNKAVKQREAIGNVLGEVGRLDSFEASVPEFQQRVMSDPMMRSLFSDQELQQILGGYDEADFQIAQKLAYESGDNKSRAAETLYRYDENGEMETIEAIQRGDRFYEAFTLEPITDRSWKRAERVGSDPRTQAAIEEEQGKIELRETTKLLESMNEQAGAVEAQISLYDDALAVVDDALMGTIDDLFPTFRAATKEIDSIRGKLALNELSLVTMGALSNEELKLLKQVAMPNFSNNEDARKWLEKRKSAQQKYLNGLYAAISMMNEGKTAREVNEWALQQKRESIGSQGGGQSAKDRLAAAKKALED